MVNIYQVSDHLFISSYRAAKKLKRLSKKGITAIVNLMEKNKYDPRPQFSYLHVALKDRNYIPHDKLQAIMDFIEEETKKGNVLVHCHSGISRSGGIIIARLLKENPKWDWNDALKHVRKITLIEPHLNIKKSILDYLESNNAN